MTGPAPAADPGFSAGALDACLRRTVPGLEGPMALERIAGGQSNPTYFVTYANRRLVLRKKPAGPILASAHAVDREHRIMSALAATDVPVPRMVAFHGEPDVVGTPFFVMERLEGRVFEDCALRGVEPRERRAMYLAMAETLARLHRVDWQALGLSDYGKAGNYFVRQIGRWSRQWESSKTRENPDIDRLSAWLQANVPAGDVTTIAHGDFRIGNLLFHPTEPRVAGVLDWELSTLGHPLADCAFSALSWRLTPSEYKGLRGLDIAALGIPPESEYLEHYYRHAPASGRATPFHFAFSLFRFAVIFEGIAARSLAGNAASADAAQVGRLSSDLARRGLEAIEQA